MHTSYIQHLMAHGTSLMFYHVGAVRVKTTVHVNLQLLIYEFNSGRRSVLYITRAKLM